MVNSFKNIPQAEPQRIVCSVDAMDDGIMFGQLTLGHDQDLRDALHLRLPESEGFPKVRSRYELHRNNASNPLWELERHLARLSNQGVLGRATIVFGVSSDPFFPFEGRFDVSMKFLQLFERYLPGLLVVQTRSPLVVIAMPVFRRLGSRVSVTMAIETNSEEAVRRYTPGLPRIEERYRALRALRNLGIEVNVQVSPLIPYGDWKHDAKGFAKELAENSNFVHVRPMMAGGINDEKKIRQTLLARRLVQDRKFHWLRPDAANPLIGSLEEIAAEKLKIPSRKHHIRKQIGMFAA